MPLRGTLQLRKCPVGTFLCPSLFACSVVNAPPQTRSDPPAQPAQAFALTLHIHLYNWACISSWMLTHATQDAAQVLATAGVDTVCWHISADAPEAQTIDRTPSAFAPKRRQIDTRGYLVVIIARGFSAIPVSKVVPVLAVHDRSKRSLTFVAMPSVTTSWRVAIQ
jgi:hypothetical protein